MDGTHGHRELGLNDKAGGLMAVAVVVGVHCCLSLLAENHGVFFFGGFDVFRGHVLLLLLRLLADLRTSAYTINHWDLLLTISSARRFKT
jgi:hypothetical protein